MSGLSTMQRAVLRLAMTINAATQNGVRRLKTGHPLAGYGNPRTGHHVPTIDYRGPVDLNAAMLLWALTDAQLSPHSWSVCHFSHTRETLCAKAALMRSKTRLLERGALVYTPNRPRRRNDPDDGYLLTAEGMRLADPEPLDVPALAAALEFFGATRLHCSEGSDWCSAQHTRKLALQDEMRMAGRNGYQGGAGGQLVTVEEARGQRLSRSRRGTSVTADVVDV